MKNIYLLLSFIISVQFSFSQCDEYYINELISGNDEKCFFESGTKVRFCPDLKGVAIGQLTLDISQWSGISTQYITVTKNGAIAGTLVLKLNEKELIVNFNGCGESRKYSISMNKKELDDFYKSKDLKIIEEINSLVNSGKFEKAFDLTSKLLEKDNYEKLSDLEKLSNEQRLSNYRKLISMSKEEIKRENYLGAAKFFSEIKLPTNLDWNEHNNYSSIRSSIEEKLKTIYKDSVIIVNTTIKFSNSDTEFNINNKEIRFNQEILNHLDSLTDGNYFLRISKTSDRYNREIINYDIVVRRFGLNFNYENGYLCATNFLEGPVSKIGTPCKINSIDGISFTSVEEVLSYIVDKETIIISYSDSLSNINKQQELNRGYVKLVSLPRDQKKCIRWMQGGGCVDYYNENLIEGWSLDSLKTIEEGVFNLSVANLIPFKLEKIVENPTIIYYTKKGETLKFFNERFYRKVKVKGL